MPDITMMNMDMFKKMLCNELRPKTNEPGETKEVMVPMDDGVKLRTFVTFPSGKGSFPVILERSPYTALVARQKLFSEELSARGYIYVFQACRGNGGSEGDWTPYVDDRKDGLATLRWIANQEWTNGIAMMGASYSGFTQWVVADSLPPEVKTLFIAENGVERYNQYYQSGLFKHDIATRWAMQNGVPGAPVDKDFLGSVLYRPHVNVDTELWSVDFPWYREWVTSVDFDSPVWQSDLWRTVREAPRTIKIPVCLYCGWYDFNISGLLSAYEKFLAESKERSSLIIHPGDHIRPNATEKNFNLETFEMPTAPLKSALEWFDKVFYSDTLPEKQIKLFIYGEGNYHDFTQWPLPSKPERFTLGKNTITKDTVENAVIEFLYNPEFPVKTIGGDGLLSYEEFGSRRQPEPNYRNDVISFISEPLDNELKIAGKMKVTLYVSSDAEDTAFTVRVMEVDDVGNACNIRDTIMTLAYRNGAEKRGTYVPNDIVELNFELWPILWTLKPDCKLRIDVSSSNCPQFTVHTNYPGIWAEQKVIKTANQKIFVGPDHPSYIELPVLQCEN